MSQQTTIRKLAELVNTPVDKLLEQLAEAGMSFSGPDQVVTSMEKVKLLGFLKRSHGKTETAAAEVVAPSRITLNRSRKQELTIGGGKAGRGGASTIDVVVRKKIVVSKPSVGPAMTPAEEQDAERAEILRKLEESRLKNLTEQQRLAEGDRKRAEELAARKRAEEEAAERVRLEAAAAAEAAVLEEAGKPKPGHHGHAHPKPAAAPRADDKGACTLPALAANASPAVQRIEITAAHAATAAAQAVRALRGDHTHYALSNGRNLAFAARAGSVQAPSRAAALVQRKACM